MTPEQFIKIVESICDVRSYSGRGMFGKQCIGITTDDPFSLLADITREIMEHDQIDNAVVNDENPVTYKYMNAWIEIMADTRTDSMGYSTIIYWPSMKWPENRPDSTDESED